MQRVTAADLTSPPNVEAAGSERKVTKSAHQFLRIPYRWINVIAMTADAAIITTASVLAGILYHLIARGGTGPVEIFIAVGCLMSVNFCAVSAASGSYSPRRLIAFRKQVGEVLAAWLLVGFALLTVAFLLKTTETFSRGATLTFFSAGLIFVIMWRAAVSRCMVRALQLGAFSSERIILITESSPGENYTLIRKLMRYGYRPVRTFNMKRSEGDPRTAAAATQELIAQVIEASRRERAFQIFLQLPWERREAIDRIVEALQMLPVSVRLLPDPNMARYGRNRVALVADLWAAELKRGRLSSAEQTAKRVLDLTVASVALILLSPLMLAVAAMIRLDSRGPVLFRQTRAGLNGVPFAILKYRTMSVMENGAVVQQATKNDPRVTRVGKWLRRTSIDELPQLINVLKGEMSLVGPRPHAISHNSKFEAFVANYAARYQMKPGMTGWAQVNGFRGENRTAEMIVRRVELDLWYVRYWSLWLDLRIMAKTIVVVGFDRAAV